MERKEKVIVISRNTLLSPLTKEFACDFQSFSSKSNNTMHPEVHSNNVQLPW